MLGKILDKDSVGTDEWIATAEWCNNNNCYIAEKDTYYEVVENEPYTPAPATPSQLDIIEAQVMYTALMTDTLIESEVE